MKVPLIVKTKTKDMIKKLISLSGALAFVTPILSQAETVAVVPQIAIAYKNLSFDQKYIEPGITSEGGFEDSILSVTGSLSLVYDQYFVSVSLENNLAPVETDSDAPYAVAESEIDRFDTSITFGMRLTDEFSAFGGYLIGVTEIEPDCAGGTLSVPLVPSNNLGNGQCGYKQEYQEDGFFIGMAYSLPVFEASNLDLRLAYAFLDSSYEDNDDTQRFDFGGDASGLSLGASFSSPITDRLYYSLDLVHRAYDSEFDDDKTGDFSDRSVETEESITSFSAGLKYVL